MSKESSSQINIPAEVAANAANPIIVVSLLARCSVELARKKNMIDSQSYSSFLNTFEPLQHVSNVGATYGIVGTSVALSELARTKLENSGMKKTAKLVGRLGELGGTATAVAYQFVTETTGILPTDTYDRKDIVYGLAAIVPSYLATKYMFGRRTRGKFKRN